ncbi:putative receptor-like protein kinase At3g47110 [Phragmites australis]|uniref:putative receptor-like protein kinase At3g47110 n=1 Tax=Phragmites australis TaxID=29695 RepID=UPI002D767766|nr:putative receptor-like protein kinase At3g47110 [Phragmites australis]
MKVTAIGQFLLLLMACSAITCSSGDGIETDRLSLLDFKTSISLDPQQALASWNDSIHLCSWEGIQCTTSNPRRVASIRLDRRGLVGQISPSLGNLTFLRNLSLATNRFTGEIPLSLGHLQHLQYLYLSNNTLQGRIPSFANCSSLRVLWLQRNGLVGHFPAAAELPSGLRQLQISVNNLAGTIPASLANITTLTVISCADNSFVGNIPDEFARLSNMQQLYVGANQLSGRFPQAVMNLSALTDLSLGLNQLSGEVPPDLGSALRNLLLLELTVNFFRGQIPPSLTNASNLYYIDISRNNFSGVVPSTIGRLNKMEMLNLEYNQLQAEKKQDWEFLDSLGNCTELIGFSMTGNLLRGHVPASLGNLTNQLQYLYLAENQLSGEFPPGIANLHSLFIVSLSVNHFTGALPEWLGTLKNLQKVSLGSNFFTGAIPSSFSNLSQLGELYLDSNRLIGQIPPSFGDLPILQVVNISNNRLHGSIPKELFRIPAIVQISLTFNNLDAPLHPDIGNAKQLTYLYLSSNNMSGEIPSTLGNCESLEDIEFDHNDFSGSIPVSLGNIRTLKALNLSHNNLTGSIPASLGNLKLLEQLDLSFNNLKGEVPTKGIFKSATTMRIDGNQELCGGPPELHLLACPVIPLDSSKHKLSVVLKVVIPVATVVSLVVLISILLFFRRKKQKTKSVSLPSFGREFPRISYSDIVRATEGFSTSNLIGQGRYGSVYQGHLFRDGNVVAIKVFSLETSGAQKSFIAECNALRNVRHRNLVPIVTACSSTDSNGNDFKALVYEFMPQGDLHNLLYLTRDSEDSSYLNYISLAQRLSIVVDVSDALAYLHHNHQGTILHCDLKPSNILLDANMVAHVGDFGLASFKFDSATPSFVDSVSTSSIAINGTVGYVAPECAGGAQVSTATDVYSFGVVLLEIFIRRRPTDDMFKDGMSIAKFTEVSFPDDVLQIVDPQLLQELDICKETLQSVLSIGLCCTKTSPSERISMQEVAAKLHGIRDAYLKETEGEVQQFML